ncbi:transporter [Sulfurimonas sp. MAG313]|nr:OmpP1/FadL family transporter [Sulfurimonas sp. MAG313]MDF1882155.1 transporter [Sulfurimonas sp. MAG313]
MKKVILMSLVTTTVIMASGYKIPEQSVNSVALSGADVANTHGADAAYSNPANMAFMEDGQYMEGTFTYINLTPVKFEGTVRGAQADANSKTENFLLPSLHYVSNAYGDFRFGASLTVPAGLTKRWQEGGPSQTIAEEFSLKVIEVNPVVSYKILDNLSIAAGVRMVYSEGIIKSSGTTVVAAGPIYQTISRDMEGDSLEFGYNLAIAYKPMKELSLALTYRSEVDLKEDGTAKLSASDAFAITDGVARPIMTNGATYDGGAGVTVPLPAVLSLATAYTFNEETTVEFVYERTGWSSYEALDFTGYAPALTGVLKVAYDDPKNRNWKDTNTFRLGVTHEFNKKWVGMAGYAYDESPSPKSTVSFELPESNANIFSLGARYSYNDDLSIGIAGLYDKKDKLDVAQTGPTGNQLNGTFSNAAAYLLSIGVGYKF